MAVRNETILKKVLENVAKARQQAGLLNEPFELGIATDKKPSLIFDVVFDNIQLFEKMGMAKWVYHDDAFKMKVQVAGEELFITVSGLSA